MAFGACLLSGGKFNFCLSLSARPSLLLDDADVDSNFEDDCDVDVDVDADPECPISFLQ